MVYATVIIHPAFQFAVKLERTEMTTVEETPEVPEEESGTPPQDPNETQDIRFVPDEEESSEEDREEDAEESANEDDDSDTAEDDDESANPF